MKKRAMKKYIFRDTPYCYIIKRVEIREDGMPVLKCEYCKNFFFGKMIHDQFTDEKGEKHPVKYREKRCRYTSEELIYDDAKQCGVGY